MPSKDIFTSPRKQTDFAKSGNNKLSARKSITSRRKNSNLAKVFSDDYDDQDYAQEDKRKETIQYIIYAGIALLFILMVMLVIQNSSLNQSNRRLQNENARIPILESLIDDLEMSLDNKRINDEANGIAETPTDLAEAQLPSDNIEEILGSVENEHVGEIEVVSAVPDTVTDGIIQGPGTIHVVARGETLGTIARIYYNSWTHYPRIMEANNLTNDNIREGQELFIPRMDD
jgi:LysM repeat protein